MGEARHYTVEEANAALERLRELLPAIRDARRALLETGEHVRGVAVRNGGGAEGAGYMRSMAALREGLKSLSGDGIILRDAETGLVDFPALSEGREIYLCWRLGEDEVAHWHELDTGMAGRRPL